MFPKGMYASYLAPNKDTNRRWVTGSDRPSVSLSWVILTGGPKISGLLCCRIKCEVILCWWFDDYGKVQVVWVLYLSVPAVAVKQVVLI